MAKGSKKGACSAHVRAAKMICLQHNRRNEESRNVPSYVNPHLSHLNHTIFEDEMIRGRKSIVPLWKRAEILYTEKTGQKCQKSFAPFREDALVFPGRGDITDEQIFAFIRKVEKEIGWKVVGAWYHKDEGHQRSKYIEGDEKFQLNYHVHLLYYCQDPETGKAIRPKRSYFPLRQDWLAAATGMQRGNPAAETGIKGRTAAEQRIHAMEQRIGALENKEKQAKKELDQVRKEIEAEKSRLAALRKENEGLNRQNMEKRSEAIFGGSLGNFSWIRGNQNTWVLGLRFNDGSVERVTGIATGIKNQIDKDMRKLLDAIEKKQISVSRRIQEKLRGLSR